MRKLTKLMIIVSILSLVACGSKSSDKPSEVPRIYDVECQAETYDGLKISYKYYHHVVDATAYNMGMRNFVFIEVEADGRYNSNDLDEDSKYFPRREIVLATSKGGLNVFMDNYQLGLEINNLPVSLMTNSCDVKKF